MKITESKLRRIINEVVSEALGHEDLEKHSQKDVTDKLAMAMAMKCWGEEISSDAIFSMCKEVMAFNPGNAMNCLDLIACCCVSDTYNYRDLDSCYECLRKICECKGCKMICMRHCGLGN